MSNTCAVFDCSDPDHPLPVASSGLDEIGNGHLAYGRFYVDKAVAFALDPLHLPLSKERQDVPRQADGSYGVLSDTGPNAWGTKLTASILKQKNQALPANPIEWLLHSWHYGSGCIGFSPHHTEQPNLGQFASSREELSSKLQAAIDALTINAGIAEAMRPFNLRGQLDSHQLYRRMIFNILIGNVDDHLRNHALLMESPGRYILSPAFDVVPHPDAAVAPQAIGVGALGAASTTANALSQCGRFLLKPDEASVIIEEVRTVLSRWQQEFSDTGVSQRDIYMLNACIDCQR